MTASLPRFHDGFFNGVDIGERSARLKVKRVNGDDWEVCLAGVEALRMDGFREGNIINCLEAITGTIPDAGILAWLSPGPHPSAAPQYHATHAEFISGKAAQVERGEAILVVLTPSYGADLVALCSDVSCQAIPTGDS